MSKTVKIIFTLSLILNVLFLGLYAGHFYHEAREPRPWDKTKEALAPETREVLKATFKGKMKEILPLFEEARQKKEEMRTVISAPELDGAAYDALAVELEDLNTKFMEHRLAAIKVIFSQLSQEEREKMATHTVERIMGNPPPRKKGWKMHYKKTKHFESTRIPKNGAIEAAPGEEPFDVREVSEPAANHGG